MKTNPIRKNLPICAGLAILALAGCSKNETAPGSSQQPVPAPAPTAQAPAAAARTPAPPSVAVELNNDTVLDALKRSSVDTLPVFLKISSATFEVVNSVDASRTVKGVVTLEFLEDTFRPSRTLNFSTASSRFDLKLLKTVKRKGEKLTLPFEARVNLATIPLSIGMPALEDYGQEIAKFRHCYPEGGETAAKAEGMIQAAADAVRKAQLVDRKWYCLKHLKDSLIDTPSCRAFMNSGNPEQEVTAAVDDEEFTKTWSQGVHYKQFNSDADRFAAHKKVMQQRLDDAYSPVEKIVTDARDKANACSEYLLTL